MPLSRIVTHSSYPHGSQHQTQPAGKSQHLHQLEEPHQDKALIENKFIFVQKF